VAHDSGVTIYIQDDDEGDEGCMLSRFAVGIHYGIGFLVVFIVLR
jgi:hypothetical protein